MTVNSGPVLTRTVTQERIDAYAEASGDHNPVHLDAEFAATTQFGGTIASWNILFGYISDPLLQYMCVAWVSAAGWRPVSVPQPARVTSWRYPQKSGHAIHEAMAQ